MSKLSAEQIHALIPKEEMLLPNLGCVHFTTTGVIFREDVDLETWGVITLEFQRLWTTMHRVLPWVLGDLLNYGDVHFHEDYVQFVEITNKAEGTLRKYAWVASRIPYELRDESIPFYVYEMLAKQDPKEIPGLLKWYVENGRDAELLKEKIEGRIISPDEMPPLSLAPYAALPVFGDEPVPFADYPEDEEEDVDPLPFEFGSGQEVTYVDTEDLKSLWVMIDSARTLLKKGQLEEVLTLLEMSRELLTPYVEE